MLHLDIEKGVAIFKATVTDEQGGIGVGHGSESVKDFGDYIEKAETKAIGRALASLGFGTQFAPEFCEGDRVVDSPVEPRTIEKYEATNTHRGNFKHMPSASSQSVPDTSTQEDGEVPATHQQRMAITTMSQRLNIPVTLESSLTHREAAALITELQKEASTRRKGNGHAN